MPCKLNTCIWTNSVRNTEGKHFAQSRCSQSGGSRRTKGFFKQQINLKKSTLNSRNSKNKYTKHNGQKLNTYFRCGSEDHFIANFQKPDTSDNKVHWNTEKSKICTYRSKKLDKMSENSTYERDPQNTYMSI